MQYHSDRFSVFFGNKTNGLEAPSVRQSMSEEEACTKRLADIVVSNMSFHAPLILLQQKHGTMILTIASHDDRKTMALRACEGDGLITSIPHTAIGVLTADCLPIIMYNHDTHELATIHAGWQGLVQGIVRKTIEKMKLASGNCTIVFGPSARVCCYQVQEDFLANILPTHACSLASRNNQLYFDLQAYARKEFELHNLSAAIVHREPACTICDTSFYSHRREGPACTQRQATIAVLHD